MSRRVPRIGRILDAVGLFLFLVGAGVYGWAWLHLRRLQDDQPTSESLESAFTAVARADRLSELSWIGASLMGVGVAVAVAAAVVARRRRSDGE